MHLFKKIGIAHFVRLPDFFIVDENDLPGFIGSVTLQSPVLYQNALLFPGEGAKNQGDG
jgi:hypothetical protein